MSDLVENQNTGFLMTQLISKDGLIVHIKEILIALIKEN